MDEEIFSALSTLPDLGAGKAQKLSTECKICASVSPAFDTVDFNKICSDSDFYAYGFSKVPVVYYRCTLCHFLFTTFFDDWSTEEFARFVYNADYIKVDGDYAEVRPHRIADKIVGMISRVPPPPPAFWTMDREPENLRLASLITDFQTL